MMDFGERDCGFLKVEGEGEGQERKCERASWVVRIGCVRLISRLA